MPKNGIRYLINKGCYYIIKNNNIKYKYTKIPLGYRTIEKIY